MASLTRVPCRSADSHREPANRSAATASLIKMNFLNVNVQCLPENVAEGQPKWSRRRKVLRTTVATVRRSSLTQTIRRLEANLQTRQPVPANQPTSASKPTNQPASQPKDDQPTHQPAQNKQPASLPHLLDIALSIDLLVKFFSRFEKVVEQNITMWDQSAHESESFEFCKHLATACAGSKSFKWHLI